MLANVREVEAYLRAALEGNRAGSRRARSRFLLGLEFADKAKPSHEALLEHKIINGTSSDANVLRLLPPLCLKREEVDLFIKKLSDCFDQ